MKFNYETREVSSVGSISTKKIGIKSGAKAFRIIFGNMYKDIIKAIVREIFTNAWDSQKKSGTLGTPIDIHAPSKWEPYFSVRDYGTGMTPDVIDGVYSDVFASTKDESNDEAGFMGMGSKTPLGYSDSFSLVSYVDGRYYAYVIFLDEHGEAEISLVSEGDTDEPNGVLIQLAVDIEDIDAFAARIEEFILGSSANVNLNGKKFENKFKVTNEFENFTMYKHDNITGPHVKMGCVLYKLDSQERSKFFNFDVIFEVDIGTFDVTGSRDDIVYNSKSRKVIEEHSERFIKKISSEIREKIASQPTYVDAVNSYEDLYSGINYNTRHALDPSNTYLWKGKQIAYPEERNSTKGKFWGYEVGIVYSKRFRKTINFTKSMFLGRPKKETIVVFDDGTAKSPSKRVAKIYNERASQYRNTSIYWVRGESRNTFSFLKLTVFLGASQVIDLSNPLIKLDKVVRNSSVKQKTMIDRISMYSGSGVKTAGCFSDINQRPNKYYVPFISRSCVYSRGEVEAAISFFGKSQRDVRAIGKTQLDIAKEYDMIDIVEEYRKHSNAIKITDSDINSIIYNSLTHYSKIIYDAYLLDDFPRGKVKAKLNREKAMADERFIKNEKFINDKLSIVKDHYLTQHMSHLYVMPNDVQVKEIINIMKKVIGEKI